MRPCLLSYSQQWLPPAPPAPGAAATPLRVPQLFASASDLRAMVTLEDARLSVRVWAAMQHGFRAGAVEADPAARKGPTPPAPVPPAAGSAGAAPETAMRLFGLNMRLELIDDLGGRWVPLLAPPYPPRSPSSLPY